MAAVLHKAGGVSKRSTKPSYDATFSSWAAIKIKGEAWMYSLGLIKALRKHACLGRGHATGATASLWRQCGASWR